MRYKDCLDGIIISVLLATLGGLAKAARSTGRITWGRLLCDLFVSAFTGLMVYFALAETTMPATAQALCIGIAGHSGPVILDAMTGMEIKVLEKVTGQKIKAPARGRGRERDHE